MIIGISGKAGSGKDTCADFLVNDCGFVKVALADPFKRMCRDVFDFSEQQLWGPSEFRNEPDKRYLRGVKKGIIPQKVYLTPRFALQTLGSEWGRNCYKNVWVDYAIRTAKAIEKAYENREPVYYDQVLGLCQDSDPENWAGECTHKGVAIPDVRVKNEIEAIKKADGLVIRVVRSGAGLQGDAANHKSETEMNSIPDSLFDEVIINDGSLDELRSKILKLVNVYR